MTFPPTYNTREPSIQPTSGLKNNPTAILVY
jgi:hypothetical protein